MGAIQFGLCGNKPFQPDMPPFPIQPYTTFEHSPPLASGQQRTYALPSLVSLVWDRLDPLRMGPYGEHGSIGLMEWLQEASRSRTNEGSEQV